MKLVPEGKQVACRAHDASKQSRLYLSCVVNSEADTIHSSVGASRCLSRVFDR